MEKWLQSLPDDKVTLMHWEDSSHSCLHTARLGTLPGELSKYVSVSTLQALSVIVSGAWVVVVGAGVGAGVVVGAGVGAGVVVGAGVGDVSVCVCVCVCV